MKKEVHNLSNLIFQFENFTSKKGEPIQTLIFFLRYDLGVLNKCSYILRCENTRQLNTKATIQSLQIRFAF